MPDRFYSSIIFHETLVINFEAEDEDSHTKSSPVHSHCKKNTQLQYRDTCPDSDITIFNTRLVDTVYFMILSTHDQVPSNETWRDLLGKRNWNHDLVQDKAKV